MSDKELLTLAAKAAGIEVRIYDGTAVNPGTDLLVVTKGGLHWNPLTSDADALRLAVKLGIEVVFTKNRIGAGRNCNQHLCSEDRKTDDPYAATRRAIVRAAAEIGRGMG